MKEKQNKKIIVIDRTGMKPTNTRLQIPKVAVQEVVYKSIKELLKYSTDCCYRNNFIELATEFGHTEAAEWAMRNANLFVDGMAYGFEIRSKNTKYSSAKQLILEVLNERKDGVSKPELAEILMEEGMCLNTSLSSVESYVSCVFTKIRKSGIRINYYNRRYFVGNGANVSSNDSVRGFVIGCLEEGPVTKKEIMEKVNSSEKFEKREDKKLLRYINTLISKIKKTRKLTVTKDEYSPGKFRGLYKLDK